MMPGWDMGMGMGMGMEFGMGIGMELEAAASVSAASIYPSTTTTASPAYGMYGLSTTDTLRVDDLLDFSNLDLFPSTAPTADTHHLPPPPPPFETSAAARSYADSSSDHHHTHNSSSFTDELYIPCEEAAELEWLSKFVDDSFSDIPYPSSDTGHLLAPSANAHLQTDPTAVPGRGARSKRSRASSTPTNHHLPNTWSSVVPPPPPPSSSTSSATSSSSSSEFPSPKPMGNSKTSGRTKVRGEVELDRGGVRRCTHCASDKTPQWRTGPMGPKTLCNACGVRYKSGRLVPEYRPASSPTFLLTQHSNSHRKVMELRRQKELVLLPHDDPSTAVNAAARPDLLFHDYEVC